MRVDELAILIPEFDTDEDAKLHLSALWEDIFAYELWAWCTQESWWPEERSEKMFWDWFEIQFHSEVIDLCSNQIKKEVR